MELISKKSRQNGQPKVDRDMRPKVVKQDESVTKKEQILSLYTSGIQHIGDLATLTDSRSSYVASVLQQAGHISGYFDLYTSTANAMNVYSKFFNGQLGFRDVKSARRSIALIDRLYRQFEQDGDRAGQHHALVMALMMYNRARWTGKTNEAEVFRQWLVTQLTIPSMPEPEISERVVDLRSIAA
jgi:hypothetical protein